MSKSKTIMSSLRKRGSSTFPSLRGACDEAIQNDKRIRIIVGHYGSGKTEFAINYAMRLATMDTAVLFDKLRTGKPRDDSIGRKVVLADLDIVNPYFRSREKAEMLEQHNIKVISSSLGHVSTMDIPALSAGIAAPLQDKSYDIILDVGGDATGAKTLAQHQQLIASQDYDMFCVLNAYREQTNTIDKAIEQIQAIESMTKLQITGIINNTHLLKATTAADVLKGQKLAETVAEQLSIPVKYVCALENILPELPQNLSGNIFPIKLYMREEWMS